jgi:hypothetical protein
MSGIIEILDMEYASLISELYELFVPMTFMALGNFG